MKYRKGYKYQVAEELDIWIDLKPVKRVDIPFGSLDIDGHMRVNAGYAWDGASGPTVDTDDSMTPSLVHDVLAQMMRAELLPQSFRLPSNEVFDTLLKERGVNHLRRGVWIRALDDFGAESTDPRNAKKVYEVD
jgi:hypothetical protein